MAIETRSSKYTIYGFLKFRGEGATTVPLDTPLISATTNNVMIGTEDVMPYKTIKVPFFLRRLYTKNFKKCYNNVLIFNNFEINLKKINKIEINFKFLSLNWMFI